MFSRVSNDWLELLDTNELKKILPRLTNITPSINNIFEFARLTPLNNIKVVILGQDPYPKAGDAHGLAFSSLSTRIPDSLRNIYKCLLAHNLLQEMPETADLSNWAKRGVLLLNTALTTETGKSKTHIKIWERYVDDLIKQISRLVYEYNGREYDPVFVLWGNEAKKKRPLIHKSCHILEYIHPSPLNGNKFLNCPNFIEINNLLTTQGLDPIEWDPAIGYLDITDDVVEEKKRADVVLERFKMTDGTVVVFTDGSCNPNKTCPQSIGGYAACIVLGKYTDTVLYGNINNRPEYATNNRAEGMAMWKTMEFLKERENEWTRLIFVTDSNFWIDMFERYMPSWDRNKMNFELKKNADMTEPMWELYNYLSIHHSIEFLHVRAHNKSGWMNYPESSYEYFCASNNEYVDSMAKYARKNVAIGEHVITKVSYNDAT